MERDDDGRPATGTEVTDLIGATWNLREEAGEWWRHRIEKRTTPSAHPGAGSRYPSLREAKVRATWATARLNELFRMHIEYAARYDGQRLHGVADPEAWKRSPLSAANRIGITHTQLGAQYPREVIQMLASEVLNHLRAVLDSVIYHLAWLDSGAEQDGTAWRVAVTTRDWARQRRSLAEHGITPEHIDKLEQFHPVVESSGWAERLNDLVQRDKHRLWPAIHAVHIADIDQVAATTEGEPQVEMMTRPATTHFVFTEDGGSVTDNLLNMSYSVSYVLLAFQPDFGEWDLMTIRQADGTSITWEQ